jgi:hypothetical protein
MDRINLDHRFWVGICPPILTEEYVALFKTSLRERIGKFSSVNSKAHISFCEFQDNGSELKTMEKYLVEFCKKRTNIPVRLSRFGRLSNAYCLFPDKQTNTQLIELMRAFHKSKPLDTGSPFLVPHISLGRGLSEDKLAEADSLFSNKIIEHVFICDNLAIRKFNDKIKQFEVYKRFEFGNPIELKLF